VSKVNEAKIHAERAMREKLDKRVLNLRTERVNMIIGKEIATKIRSFVRLYSETAKAEKSRKLYHQSQSLPENTTKHHNRKNS